MIDRARKGNVLTSATDFVLCMLRERGRERESERGGEREREADTTIRIE